MLNFLLEISCTCKKNRYSYIKVCIEIVIIFTIGDYRSILELLDGFYLIKIGIEMSSGFVWNDQEMGTIFWPWRGSTGFLSQVEMLVL